MDDVYGTSNHATAPRKEGGHRPKGDMGTASRSHSKGYNNQKTKP